MGRQRHQHGRRRWINELECFWFTFFGFQFSDCSLVCLFVFLRRFGSELQEYLLFNMNCSKHFGCLSGNVVSKFKSKEDGQQNLGGLSYCDKLELSPTTKQAVNFSIFSDNQLQPLQLEMRLFFFLLEASSTILSKFDKV